MSEKYFIHEFQDKVLKIALHKKNIFLFLKIELTQNGYKILSTTKIPIAKPVLEDFIHTLRHGKPFLETAGFTLQDETRSSFILYKGYRSLIVRVRNQMTDSIYEFNVDNIDRESLAEYLEGTSAF